MEEKFEARLHQVIPPQLWEGLAVWNAASGVVPIPVPSMSSSNSAQHVSLNMVTPPSYPLADPFAGLMKEICPRGNNNIVIIIFLVHDNVYIPC
jgi:hypothetical protein